LTLALFFWWIDIWEREPLHEIVLRLFWGSILASVYVALFSSIIPKDSVWKSPIIEEFVKGLGVLFIFSRHYPFENKASSKKDREETISFPYSHVIDIVRQSTRGEKEMDTPLDGIIYGSMIGLGFSLMENSLDYALFSGSTTEMLNQIFLRSIVFGFSHAMFTSFIGMGVGYSREFTGIAKAIFPTLGFILAVIFHISHNYYLGLSLIHAIMMYIFGVLLIMTIIMLYLKQERDWLYEELLDEIRRDILTKELVDLICSFGFRLKVDWKRIFEDDILWKEKYLFLQQCSKLALKKHRLKISGVEDIGFREIDKLRKSVFKSRNILGYDN
jgi:protease PrsW